MNQRLLPLPRLAFGNASAGESTDIEALAESQRAAMPAIRRYEPLDGGRGFRHRAAVARVGAIRLVASASTPVSVSVGESADTTLLVPFHGWSTSVIDCREHQWRSGAAAMFLPGTAREGRSSVRSVLAITFDPQRLLATARAMAGAGDRLAADLRTPRTIPFASSQAAALAMLRPVLSLIDLARGDESALRLLGIEDTLHRLLALLLVPGAAEMPLSVQRVGRSAAAVRRATEHIEAMLPRAIPLSDLERVTGLSARSLQIAFRREHGVSPRDWIRERRLLMAHERLGRASPGETVTEIALACGFSRFGGFAAAYARRFGETPSTTLARRCS